MLPRRERLTSSGAFRAVVARGRSYRGRFLSLYCLPRSGGPSRFGVSAGKKVGGAVQRNRAKRLLREAYRALKEELNGAVYVVAVARPEAAAAGLAQVRAELESLMRRARILNLPAGEVS